MGLTLFGGLPRWSYHSYGYGPSGIDSNGSPSDWSRQQIKANSIFFSVGTLTRIE